MSTPGTRTEQYVPGHGYPGLGGGPDGELRRGAGHGRRRGRVGGGRGVLQGERALHRVVGKDIVGIAKQIQGQLRTDTAFAAERCEGNIAKPLFFWTTPIVEGKCCQIILEKQL